jgi:arylsulfatase A
LQGKEELVEKYRQKSKTNHTNPIYAAMIESIDENVGKVLASLDELGLAENTVVILTSDNGGLLGGEKNRVTDNAPLRSGKGYPFEGGIRVPTVIRWPGVIANGSLSDVPIISIDYLPTMLDIVGLDPQNHDLDGASILGVLKSNDKIKRDLFWHFPHYRHDDVIPYTIVRSGPYKLIYYYDNTPNELYHLIEDVSEANNLALKEPDLVKELEDKIDTWLKKTNAKTPKLK